MNRSIINILTGVRVVISSLFLLLFVLQSPSVVFAGSSPNAYDCGGPPGVCVLTSNRCNSGCIPNSCGTYPACAEDQPCSCPLPTPNLNGNSLIWGDLYDALDQSPKGGPMIWLNSNTTIGNIVGVLILYLYPFIGLLLLFYIIYGGFSFIVASGNPGKIASAYQILTNGLVGFAIVFTAYWMTQIIGIVLGLPDFQAIFGS